MLPDFKHDLLKQKKRMEGKVAVKQLREEYKAFEVREMAIHEQMQERQRQMVVFINSI